MTVTSAAGGSPTQEQNGAPDMTPSELHDAAMVLAYDGDRLRSLADRDGAAELFAMALDLERRAAEAETTEPSKGILYRSAAWLALEAMNAREAKRLAAAGLAGRDVNAKIAEELREVLEVARVRLHGDLGRHQGRLK